MRTAVFTIAVVLAVVLFAAGVARLALTQGQIGLGGKDVRVPLRWIERLPESPPALAAGDYGRRVQHGGLARFYELHVPPGYDPSRPHPLVLVFHGGGSYPAGVRYESRMDEVSDREKFLVVYPGGTNQLRFPKDRLLTWNDGRKRRDGSANTVDDVGFVVALLADVARLVNVDPRRVYATGYSNGAQFSYRLVKQQPERFAAVAAVAGQRAADDLFPPPERAVPVMQFAGKLDRVGPYDGGGPPRRVEFITNLKPIPVAIRSWAEWNGCPAEPTETQRVGRAVMTRYAGCRDNSEVVLWTLEDGGHTWPSGNVLPAVAREVGPVNRDIFAAELMWEFFERHPLPER